MKTTLLILAVAVTTVSCNRAKEKNSEAKNTNMQHIKLDTAAFTEKVDGKQVGLYFLKNKNGVEMAVTNYGAKVVSLMVPDKAGNFADIVLGFDNLKGYQTSSEKYFGSAIGRYGNRIADGKFTLNGTEYTLATNNGPNTLHGGNKGFDAVVWDVNQPDEQHLAFHYLSKDGEEGFPGNLDVTMIYELTDDDEFKITYKAETDATTVINLTHHSFFNLHGAGNGTINDHVLMLNADRYTPVDATLIPTGELASVSGTPMDFQQAATIGSRLDTNAFEQLKFGRGYDHNFVLNRGEGTDSLMLAATVLEPESGRYMEVYTTEPGIQFYGGNFLDGSIIGKNQKPYNFRAAFCLETQHFPDSPNQESFPSVVLKPGETYNHTCIYKFGVKK